MWGIMRRRESGSNCANARLWQQQKVTDGIYKTESHPNRWNPGQQAFSTAPLTHKFSAEFLRAGKVWFGAGLLALAEIATLSPSPHSAKMLRRAPVVIKLMKTGGAL